MSRRDDKMAELIAHQAAMFIELESSGASLITVTHAHIGSQGDRVTVFVSVFPEDQGRTAVAFLERIRGEFRDYLGKHARIRPLPAVHFQLDDKTSQAPQPLGDVVPE